MLASKSTETPLVRLNAIAPPKRPADSLPKPSAKRQRVAKIQPGQNVIKEAICGKTGEHLKYIAFGSKTKRPELSNFFECIVIVTVPALDFLPTWMHGLVLETCSVEHMWHLLCCMASYKTKEAAEDVIKGFTTRGRLTVWMETNKNGDLAVKPKGPRDHIGLMAKKFSNMKEEDSRKKHGFSNKRKHFDKMDKLWKTILLAKYRLNPHLREILLSTGDYLLVEEVRFSRPVSEADQCFWGGFVSRKPETNGKMYGHNYMGRRMMRVRELIIAETV
jgi:hypothetical protein